MLGDYEYKTLMNIRPYRENDFAAIVGIYADSKLDELRFEGKAFQLLPLEDDATRLAELMESDIYVYVSVCENENENIVAYGALYGSVIRALFVSPSARGKGVGKELLEFMLRKVDGKVKGSASLYVAKSNTPAKQLYQQYGFKVTAEFETHYNGGSVFANKMVRDPMAVLNE